MTQIIDTCWIKIARQSHHGSAYSIHAYLVHMQAKGHISVLIHRAQYWGVLIVVPVNVRLLDATHCVTYCRHSVQ